ncbi:MAG: substrate-binding domain-containing protein [Cyanobacteria bacterium J06600_6]
MNYQLSRRHFIQSSAAIALLQLLGGCAQGNRVSQIFFLENSIPPQLIKDFSKSLSQEGKVIFKPQTHIPQIFDSLFNLQHNKKPEQTIKKFINKILNKSELSPSLITLGDTWLSEAISQDLIQPFSPESWDNWQNLPKHWQKLVRRDPQGDLADNGAVYGAPYRWGCTVIAYRRDKLGSLNITLKDWEDLWQPELNDRFSLLDSPREIIGLTLKKLGGFYNSQNLDNVANLEAELLALQRQAKLYSSDRYLEPLVLGDTWAAVAWSTDILPLQKRYPEIEFVIPESGTSVWADIWVKPKLAESVSIPESDIQPSVSDRWIDYCWQAKTASKISQFTNGISPILTGVDLQDVSPKLQQDIFLNSEALNSDKSEFLLPLKPETEKQYRDLWLKVRQS